MCSLLGVSYASIERPLAVPWASLTEIKLFSGIEYGAAAAQQGDLADHLLQQCLVPVVPNPRELTGGLWFRCRLCNRVELTSKLSSHARQYHHTDHVTDCIARYTI